MRGYWHHLRFTKEDNAEAQRLLQKAIVLDQKQAKYHIFQREGPSNVEGGAAVCGRAYAGMRRLVRGRRQSNVFGLGVAPELFLATELAHHRQLLCVRSPAR